MNEEYDSNYISDGVGITNTGASCYFNSMIQCLLSCPILTKKILETEDDSKYVYIYKSICKNFLENKPICNEVRQLNNEIIILSRQRQDIVQMTNGQEDADEALMIFLEQLEKINNVRMLLFHRYRVDLVCSCQSTPVSSFKVTCNTFIIDDTYIKNDTIVLDGLVDNVEYKCEKCNNTSVIKKIQTLTMIPEILIVVMKKYTHKTLINYPTKLKFLSKSQHMMYELVAKCEHSGNQFGGHYWTECKRKNGWQILNDSSVGQYTTDPQPADINTYLVLYNYIKTE